VGGARANGPSGAKRREAHALRRRPAIGTLAVRRLAKGPASDKPTPIARQKVRG
jgi:hypothetical protein